MSLIIGKTYIIKDCRGDKKAPNWVYGMDRFIGTKFTIEKEDNLFGKEKNYISVQKFGYIWSERWLKLEGSNYDKLLDK